MEENNIRLIDEALNEEPIKNTFRLAWEFIKLNQTFTVTVLTALIVLNLLGMVPLVSLFTSILAGVLGITLQMYAGRAVYESESISNYLELIGKSDIKEIFSRHARAAFGAYMGWMVLLLIFVFVASIIAVSSGIINEGMNEVEVLMALASIGLPLVIVVLILSYVQPLVHSNIVLANSFQEGFKAVFTIFSKDVWSSAMQKSYFSYVAILGLVLILFVLPLVILFSFMGMGIIFNLIVVIASYILMIIMSVAAMMARRIVEE